MSDLPIISIVTFLPLLGALLLLFVERRRETAIKHLAFGVSLLTFLASLSLYVGFQLDVPGMQFVERAAWIPSLGIQYLVGVAPQIRWPQPQLPGSPMHLQRIA